MRDFTTTIHEFTTTIHEITNTLHAYTTTIHELTTTIHEFGDHAIGVGAKFIHMTFMPITWPPRPRSLIALQEQSSKRVKRYGCHPALSCDEGVPSKSARAASNMPSCAGNPANAVVRRRICAMHANAILAVRVAVLTAIAEINIRTVLAVVQRYNVDTH